MDRIPVGNYLDGGLAFAYIGKTHPAPAEPISVRTGKSIGPSVLSALAGRRTVRITYRRAADEFSVAVRQGDEVIERIVTVCTGKHFDTEAAEAIAEREAASAARCRGLDISRVDVP